jgi:hypothetical protein
MDYEKIKRRILMIKKQLLIITAFVLSIGFLFGCNRDNNAADNNDNLTETNMTRDVAATNDDDDDMDWGWLGLIGLAGLLGRRRDNRKE